MQSSSEGHAEDSMQGLNLQTNTYKNQIAVLVEKNVCPPGSVIMTMKSGKSSKCVIWLTIARPTIWHVSNQWSRDLYRKDLHSQISNQMVDFSWFLSSILIPPSFRHHRSTTAWAQPLSCAGSCPSLRASRPALAMLRFLSPSSGSKLTWMWKTYRL